MNDQIFIATIRINENKYPIQRLHNDYIPELLMEDAYLYNRAKFFTIEDIKKAASNIIKNTNKKTADIVIDKIDLMVKEVARKANEFKTPSLYRYNKKINKFEDLKITMWE